MFKIEIMNIVSEGVSREEWKDKRIYRSPNGQYRMEFSDPMEFAMGSNEWKATLLDNGVDVTVDHSLLKNKWMLPFNYQPWNCDSNKVFLMTKNGIRLYNLITKKIEYLLADFHIRSLLGSKRFPGYLISTDKAVIIFDINRQTVVPIDLKVCYLFECPAIGWIPNKDSFFVLGRESEETSPILTFYDSNNCRSIQSIKLDPNELVPYKFQDYEGISRKACSLNRSNGVWTVGYFLDEWHDIEFNEEFSILSFKVCRPTSGVYKSKEWSNELECKVKDVLVEIAIKIN